MPAAPPPFTVSLEPHREEVFVVLEGELDLAGVDVLEREVRELRSAGFTQIVLDLRPLRFLDCAGLGVLVSLGNEASANGHAIELVPGPRAVQRLFELTGTRDRFAWRHR